MKTMIKQKAVYLLILLTVNFSCTKELIEEISLPPIIEIYSVYSTDRISGEATFSLANVLTEIPEAGIVWSEKNNPTIADKKISFAKIKENKILSLSIDQLVLGKKYYVKAYYDIKGKITYSNEELELIHSYSDKWQKLGSPIVDADSYVMSYNMPPLGFNTTVNCFAVNKFSNSAKPVTFYPNFDEWDVRFYNPNNQVVKNITFEPIVAPFNINDQLQATLFGGGYTKKLNGEKFFLKNFKLEGIDGYTWDPQYPGANVVATGFGIKDQPYVLENSSNGILWNFNPSNNRWRSVSTVPVAKDAKYLTLDVGNRAFVLLEPTDWTDKQDAFFEYNAEANKWEKRTVFPGDNRRRGVFFILKNKVYYGLGQSASTLKGLKDIWEYNPQTDVWKKSIDYPGAGSIGMVAVGNGNFAYLGFGNQVLVNASKGETFNDCFDFWKFKPD